MTPRKRIVLSSLVLSAAAIAGLGILGAVNVPSGFNIAAAIIIALGAAVETPLMAMAVAKHKPRPHQSLSQTL
ncbi:MAG: hypothetical protein EON60_05915 [Alphaproteobacteria bacterium]|nr:MAG: hypothetical protein EON60_05915 [Alphaproteobacteria bacterium]